MIAIFFTTLSIQSQTTTDTIVKKSITTSNLSERKNAIAVSFGSPGIGFELARKLTNKLTARVAYHMITLKDYKKENVSIGNDNVTIVGNLETKIWDFGGEYLPFTSSSFKIAFGLGVLSNVNLQAKITYQEDITFGSVTVTANNVGRVLIDSKWSGAAPFLGIGFGRAVPKKRIGLSFEIGTYFTGSPKVALDATKLLAPTKDQETNLQETFETLKFIPRAQIKLTIKL